MTFEKALAALKKGQRLRRAAWGDNVLWLEMKTPAPSEADLEPPAHFELATDQGATPWVGGQGDLLGSDWSVVTQ